MCSVSQFVYDRDSKISKFLKSQNLGAYKFNLLPTTEPAKQKHRDMFLDYFTERFPDYKEHEICIVDCRKLGDPNDKNQDEAQRKQRAHHCGTSNTVMAEILR